MSEYDLAVSIEGLGILVPIIKNKQTGHIIDGKHRTTIDPKAPVFDIDIPEDLEPIARLAINNVRRNADQDESEWADILSKIIGIQGKKPDEIAKLTGISVRTVYRHMPQSLKDEKISKGTSEAKSEISRQNLPSVKPSSTTQETSQLQLCEGCKTYQRNITPWHNRLSLCPDCQQKATQTPEVFEHVASIKNGTAKILEKKNLIPTETNMKPCDFDGWTQKKAMMTTQHSKMETMIVNKLRAKGYTVETDIPIIVYELSTIPDFNLSLNDGRWIRGYVDNAKTHGPKQADRDEELRELLRKKCPKDPIVAVQTLGDSEKEADEKVEEILESLKWST